eukprot:TRINITY_DN24087_c0_g1_i4.p1 TRINITY_DN24087_c0_g1~~TRINITY_DN24087_c0_g1_i4.p1  ORF type:complete len:152 (-),score=34.46 TRINITY_DN24087_c0_g1_i4:96-551(-)
MCIRDRSRTALTGQQLATNLALDRERCSAVPGLEYELEEQLRRENESNRAAIAALEEERTILAAQLTAAHEQIRTLEHHSPLPVTAMSNSPIKGLSPTVEEAEELAKMQRHKLEQLTLHSVESVSYTHLRAHETPEHLVCRLLLEKKKIIR